MVGGKQGGGWVARRGRRFEGVKYAANRAAKRSRSEVRREGKGTKIEKRGKKKQEEQKMGVAKRGGRRGGRGQ